MLSKKYLCILIYIVESTDWVKKKALQETNGLDIRLDIRLQSCVFSGLVIGWWSKLWVAPYPTQS